jgi:ribosomal-protein-alanine N-acetyltransferase
MAIETTQQEKLARIEIRFSNDEEHIRQCARIMTDLDPWTRMGITYDLALHAIQEPEKERIVALRGDEVVGFSVLQVYKSIGGYIRILAVLPQMRGIIGLRLLQVAEDRIFRETPNIFACVAKYNHRSLKMLLKGYSVIGELPDYFIAGQTEILMRKTICPLYDTSLPSLHKHNREDYDRQEGGNMT